MSLLPFGKWRADNGEHLREGRCRLVMENPE